MKLREEEHGRDCPLAIAAQHQSKPSMPSPIGKKPNEVESPPQSVDGVERRVYRKSLDEAVQS